jgi:4-hydroxybenzoate polyprenyltransferase
MNVQVALRLGRVSNLPTVWSNVLAACALCGALPSPAMMLGLCLAMSLAYVGGMFLNDAFDREYDAKHRPERPIPAGQVSAVSVFTSGGALLASSILLVAAVSSTAAHGAARATLSAMLLVGSIVLYDMWHKNNPLSPLIMGVCRVLVYVTAAHTVIGAPPLELWLGAAALYAYLIALSAIAKHEVARELSSLVSHMIAGISVLDAALAAQAGHHDVALVCLLCWPATLAAQRYVAGT